MYERLSITEEQVEKFNEWEDRYADKLHFAMMIFRLERGEEKCKESRGYKLLASLNSHLGLTHFGEVTVTVNGKVITSDIQFGYELRGYVSGFKTIVSEYFEEMSPDSLIELLYGITEVPKIFGISNP